MELSLFGKEVESVFALNGRDENSATYALGWALSQSPALLAAFGEDLNGQPTNFDGARVDLQRSGQDRGFTDIEISSVGAAHHHYIIEAKRYWELPAIEQLTQYIHRIDNQNGGGGLIISLSAASQEYACKRLPRELEGIRVKHRSWGDLSKIVSVAYGKTTSSREKLWLDQLRKHLKGYISMRNVRDNLAYVVSLSADPIRDGNPYTWINVVENDRKYFHPVGGKGRKKGYPPTPPNYIGFRRHGRLHSVHHIESADVVTDLSQENEQWPEPDTETENGESNERFVYKLGPGMLPKREIRNGRIRNNGRVWCAIDTLLSGEFQTISDARDETKRRLEAS